MDIQTEKIRLMQLLLNTDSPSIIQSIKEVFNKNKTKDFWDELSKEQQQEIKKGSKEIDEGKTTDYDAFISKHR
jgi:predicted Zn-ribbon and HTH transcriptional regulator